MLSPILRGSLHPFQRFRHLHTRTMRHFSHTIRVWATILEQRISSKPHLSCTPNTVIYFHRIQRYYRHFQVFEPTPVRQSVHFDMVHPCLLGIPIWKKSSHDTSLATRKTNSHLQKSSILRQTINTISHPFSQVISYRLFVISIMDSWILLE